MLAFSASAIREDCQVSIGSSTVAKDLGVAIWPYDLMISGTKRNSGLLKQVGEQCLAWKPHSNMSAPRGSARDRGTPKDFRWISPVDRTSFGVA
jgi:hypothetical protein